MNCIRGTLSLSSNARSAEAYDVVAGNVLVRMDDGSSLAVLPTEFTAATGESGEALLRLLLPIPAVSTLFRGATRESLVNSYAAAVQGVCETRSWDDARTYVLNDDEGGAGLVRFDPGDAVGAFSTHEIWREYDLRLTLRSAPEHARAELSQLVESPMLASPSGVGVTSLFWSRRGGALESAEPWFLVYIHGASLLARELLDDADWIPIANAYYGMETALLEQASCVAARRESVDPLVLTRDELDVFVPSSATNRNEGLARLLSGGAIVVR